MSNDLSLDRSGNGNNWTTNNLSFSDQMLDTPTNNFCTLNPLASNGGTFSEGNNTFFESGGDEVAQSSFGTSTGKWYFEVYINAISNYVDIGVGSTSSADIATPQTHMEMAGYYMAQVRPDSIYKFDNGSSSSSSSTNASGDIVMVAYDADSNKLWVGINGTWLESGNPTSGTNTYISMDDGYTTLTPTICTKTNGKMTTNFGQDSSFAGNDTTTAGPYTDGGSIGDFFYEPPSGFLALCTKNLPDPAVIPSEHFNTVLWTGNGTTGTGITGVGFQPDFTWLKGRDIGSDPHQLYDAVRGATKSLKSNAADAEITRTTGLTAFGSDGFTIGNHAYVNRNTSVYVAWNWKANGAGSANSEGTLTTTKTSASTDAGISIMTWTGNEVNGATVGHGLNSTPEMIIIKSTSHDGQNWCVHHKYDWTKYVKLNLTDAETSASGTINNTAPTDIVFSLADGALTNSMSRTYMAYVFHSVAGYSKVGSYTGNGSTDGTFVYTGFRPAYFMQKEITDGGSWYLFDNKRSPNNAMDIRMLADNTTADDTSTDNHIDFLSNGVKLRHSTGNSNQSGKTMIYIAFAEVPFKFSNAR